MLRMEITADRPVAGDGKLTQAARDLYLDLKRA
jgi:hypothetical protein